MTYSAHRREATTMKIAAAAVAVLALIPNGTAQSQTRRDAPRPLDCVSSEETRNLFVTNKLVPPFRVMREASRVAQAEAIDIQLCRAQGVLVYDVTLLDRNGRVIHRLVGASNGAVYMGRAPDKETPPPVK